MFKHYLTTALRHFRQNKATAAINLACLTLGIACFIFAWGIFSFIVRSDDYHANAKRLFTITEKISLPGTDISYPDTPSAAWPVAEYLRTDFPKLEVARASSTEEIAVAVDGRKSFMKVSFVDAEMLRFFDIPFMSGDSRHALDEPRSAVISKALALRLFDSADVIGRALLLNNQETVFVRGVMTSIPLPSHMSLERSTASLSFEALVSMDVHKSFRAIGLPPAVANMRFGSITGWLNYHTYVLLPHDGSESQQSLNAQMEAFVARHSSQSKVRADLTLRPVTAIPELGLNLFIGTDKTGVSSTSLLLLLGVLVLLVSCLNYANLEAAQADTRVKETVLRRIVGAGGLQIFIQHLVEAFLVSLAALAIALLIAGFTILISDQSLSAALRLALFDTPIFWALMVALVLIVGLIASIYPGVVLSRVKPAHGLRTKRSRSGSRLVAALLVGAQFSAASFLLITVFVMRQQNGALQEAGVTSDPIVMIANDAKSASVDADVLRTELLRQPHVRAVTATMTQPWSLNGNSYGTVATTDEVGASMNSVVQQYVDRDFFAALGFKLLAGRVFDIARGADEKPTDEVAVVIDAELASQIGASSPAAALDRILFMPTSPDRSTPSARARIVGVVENKPLSLMGLGATATLYQFNPQIAKTPLIKISKSNIQAGIAEIETVWNRLAPNIALKRRFLDEQFDQNYQIFRWVTNGFAGLAVFAFIIAAMGLVGMAIHVASRRLHEIGVRKTLGATTLQITTMLLRDFCRPVVIANLIAWPLAYVAVQAYLSVFVHRIGVSALPFLASLIVVLLIACASVAGRAIRAARLNPATVLRYE